LDITSVVNRYSMRNHSDFNEAQRIGIQVAGVHSYFAFPSIIKNYWPSLVLVLLAFSAGSKPNHVGYCKC
jgi:hypothetical protein